MMDWTDRHCRYFHRRLSAETLLYTEMVTAAALVRGQALHLLDYNPEEHPVALQLGGADPGELAEATALAVDYGYDEVNLNCGCPSDRVQAGTFGAVLMHTPQQVAACVRAMGDAAGPVPVTIKCRLGVDDQNVQETLPNFIDHMAGAGVTRLIIHARKAWLKGLSPKENREVPPLDYDLARRMKVRHPQMHISINGGIDSLSMAQKMLHSGFDGVMIGRAAYHNPYDILGQADQQIFQCNKPSLSRVAVVHAMRPYLKDERAKGTKLSHITRHMLGLFAGQPGAKQWRRTLSEQSHRADAGLDVIDEALAHFSETID